MASLKDKTISGAFWSFFEKFGSKGVSILTTIILARLLTPKDFGLIGMLTIFISVSEGIANGGFNKALIQKKGADDEDYSSVFWINLVVSCCLYFVMFFSAPLIAEFYSQPKLTSLTRVLSLVFVINSFSYVQKSRLTKKLRFKTLMLIHVPSIVISAIVAVIMAYRGFGVWSLVAQQIVMRLTYAVQIWIYAKWKPLWKFNRRKAKGLFSFGGRLLVSSTLDKIYDNIYLIVIGKFFPIQELGYFKNAYTLTRIPSKTIGSGLKQVTFPTFSAIQDDNKRLKIGYRKSIQQVLFWICPMLLFAGALATPLFRFVLTEKWLPAVPYFQILCLMGIFSPINGYTLDIVNVKGRSDIFLRLNIVKKVITTIGLIVIIPFGSVIYLVAFRSFTSLINYFINSFYSGRYINYSVREQITDITPTIFLSLIIAVGLNLFAKIAPISDFLVLITGAVIGFAAYWLLAYLINLDARKEFLKIIKGKMASKFLRN